MQSLKLPVAVPSRQMKLLLEDSRLEGFGVLERNKVISILAQILMLAAGVRVEDAIPGYDQPGEQAAPI